MIFKINWIIRRFLYAIFFKNISFHGYLGKPITIIRPSKLTLKKNTRIFPGCRFEVHSSKGEIVVNENCSIGQNFHCTAMGKLIIEKNTLITSNVCITDIDHDYSQIGTPIFDQKYLNKKTHIGSNCFIGFGSVIQAGTTLGDNCIIGANSVVRGAFPPFSVIVGSPAKIIKKYDPENNSWVRV
tara:strand:- start:1101 stop:1652 length:552 start_codon:yes stop_codon:yes gene_type:complete